MNRYYDPTRPLPSEYREGAAPAAKPRDAATLIVIRGQKEPEILMGKRAASHKFMPNKFVFPGGKLDVADQRLNFDSSRYRTNKRPVDSRCLSGAFTDFSQKDPMSTQTDLN